MLKFLEKYEHQIDVFLKYVCLFFAIVSFILIFVCIYFGQWLQMFHSLLNTILMGFLYNNFRESIPLWREIDKRLNEYRKDKL